MSVNYALSALDHSCRQELPKNYARRQMVKIFFNWLIEQNRIKKANRRSEYCCIQSYPKGTEGRVSVTKPYVELSKPKPQR
jgi:predicted SnoaL-like aldol condensation-catalyzing enzyme